VIKVEISTTSKYKVTVTRHVQEENVSKNVYDATSKRCDAV